MGLENQKSQKPNALNIFNFLTISVFWLKEVLKKFLKKIQGITICDTSKKLANVKYFFPFYFAKNFMVSQIVIPPKNEKISNNFFHFIFPKISWYHKL